MAETYADPGNADFAMQERIADAEAARCDGPAQVALKQEAQDRGARAAFFGFMSSVSVGCRKEGGTP